MINYRHIVVFRNDIFADAFRNIGVGMVVMKLAGLMEFLQDRSVGIDPDHFDVRIFLFKEGSASGNGTACSGSYHKVGKLSFGLIPDLRGSRFVMRRSVG